MPSKPCTPATCTGREGHDIDPETAEFSLTVNVSPLNGIVEVFAVFEERKDGDCKGSIHTGIVDLPYGSAEAIRAVALERNPQKQEELRQGLLRRIKDCKGICGGVCWALGESNFTEMLRKFLSK